MAFFRLQGGLIDTSGTMSGGGGKVASGGMRCQRCAGRVEGQVPKRVEVM